MRNEPDERNDSNSLVSGIGCFRLAHSTNIICKASCFVRSLGNAGVRNDVFVSG